MVRLYLLPFVHRLRETVMWSCRTLVYMMSIAHQLLQWARRMPASGMKRHAVVRLKVGICTCCSGQERLAATGTKMYVATRLKKPHELSPSSAEVGQRCEYDV